MATVFKNKTFALEQTVHNCLLVPSPLSLLLLSLSLPPPHPFPSPYVSLCIQTVFVLSRIIIPGYLCLQLLPVALYQQYSKTLTYGVFSNLYLPVPRGVSLISQFAVNLSICIIVDFR